MLNENSATIVSKEIVDEYYNSVKLMLGTGDFAYMTDFKEKHPSEFSILNAIHHRRVKVNNCVDAMSRISDKVYFGTLTFNQAKDKNKRSSKRKEAFTKLNRLFRYVLLVEELGELHGRYHIHFVGIFKDGYGFDDFKTFWHSRQNIELVKDQNKVCRYLVKYLVKELPRIRRNKPLIGLEREYKKGKRMDTIGFNSLGIQNSITIFDLLLADEI